MSTFVPGAAFGSDTERPLPLCMPNVENHLRFCTTPIERVPFMSRDASLTGFKGLHWRDGFLTATRLLVLLALFALALGFVAKALSDVVDRPAFAAIERSGANEWTEILATLTKMGNVPQTQLLAAVLAIVMAMWFWRRGERWWMPIVVFPAAWGVARIFQFGVAGIVDRDRGAIAIIGTNVGAFPSGGVLRIIVVTGVAVFLAAQYGGISKAWEKRGYMLVAILGLAEAYFRTRLNQHWLTDVISGLIIGWLFLGVVIATVKAFDPRPRMELDDELVAGYTALADEGASEG